MNIITRNTLIGWTLALSSSMAYSGGNLPAPNTNRVYFGLFGGVGSLRSTDSHLAGTAFFSEAEGGPLAINAIGSSNSNSTGVVGGHIGFAWPSNYLSVTPALELEGYYMGGAEIEGHQMNDDNTRLPEHDFLVTYPLKTAVFLVNAVFQGNEAWFGLVKPYVGVGIGSALVSISGATAIQTDPAEPGIDHFNNKANARDVAFAAQPKIGVHINVSPRVNLFAEYRFLYLSDTNFILGSTNYSTHVPTSPWEVNIESQHYHIGTIGVEM